MAAARAARAQLAAGSPRECPLPLPPGPSLQVLSSSYHRVGRNTQGQIFYFDFGCVVFWGLDAVVERCVCTPEGLTRGSGWVGADNVGAWLAPDAALQDLGGGQPTGALHSIWRQVAVSGARRGVRWGVAPGVGDVLPSPHGS